MIAPMRILCVVGTLSLALSLAHSFRNLPKSTEDSVATPPPWSHEHHSFHLFSRNDIRRYPFRRMENYLSLDPAIVFQDGILRARGGRTGEISYMVNDVSVTNRFTNTNGVYIIPEAIEQLEFTAAPFDAKHGWSAGGLVQTRMKIGKELPEYSLNIETDDFARPGNQLFNTSAFGYRNIVATLSGPLPYGMKGFLAGEHHFTRNRQQMFLGPMKFENLVTDEYSTYQPGTPLPGPIEFKRNYLYNNWYERNTIQGNLSVAVAPDISFCFSGSLQKEKSPEGGGWPAVLREYFRQDRLMLNEASTSFVSLELTQTLTPEVSYKAKLSYQDYFTRLTDPDFGDDWQLFTDSLANAQKGYSGFTRRYRGPSMYSTILFFSLNHPNSPNTQYRKQDQSAISFNLDVHTRINKRWTLDAGVGAEEWILREYSISNIPYLMETLYGRNGMTPETFQDSRARRLAMFRSGNMRVYGYNVDRSEAQEGDDGPRRPRFISVYAANTFAGSTYTLSVGGRYEIYHLRLPTIEEKDYRTFLYDYSSEAFAKFESKLDQTSSTGIFLPHIDFSAKLSDKLDSYVTLTGHAQMVGLNEMALDHYGIWYSIVSRPGYFAPSQIPLGHLLKPQRATQVEVGILYTPTDHLDLRLVGYYKKLSDQAELGFVDTVGRQTPLYALVNSGAGSVKGVEFTLLFHHTKRLAATFSYSLSEALGKGSNPKWNLGQLNDYLFYTLPPNFTVPLDFDVRHRAILSLDYRFDRDDGSILDGLGIASFITAKSGHPYTLLSQPYFGCGGTTVWNWAVGSLIDSRRGVAIEPPNSSRTPWVVNIDLQLTKQFDIASVSAEIYLNVLNLLNTKQVLNVYPLTGDDRIDGWFADPLSKMFVPSDPLYTQFYNAINMENRWSYMSATGNDIYGSPRQLRLGLRVGM